MSSISVRKALLASGLFAALVVVACGDDNDDSDTTVDSGVDDAGDTPSTDAGKTDASTSTDAGKTDAAAAAPVTCGSPAVTCTPHMILTGPVAAGCAKNEQDEEVCGISSTNVLMGNEPLFLEKNAPGVDSTSCGAFYDSLETPAADAGADAGSGSMGNGKIDVAVKVAGMTYELSYSGCCTSAGYCSGNGTTGTVLLAGSTIPSDNGYGCMKSQHFFNALPEVAPAGTPIAGLKLREVPCDPKTGVIKLPTPAGSDAGTGDAGAGDAGASDAGASDAGASDAGTDAATSDAATDAGLDAATTDSGSDAS
jgi:hypothetical protein